MINLLPDDYKKQVRAGRANLLLMRYNLLMIGMLVFVILAVGIFYIYLISARASAEINIANDKVKTSELAEVEKKATKFKSDLATAKQILDQEIVYTDKILDIAKLIPKDVVIDSLPIDPKTFGTSFVLSARSKSSEGASELKESLQKSPIFSDVHFDSLTINEESEGGYKYSVSLNVIINKDNIEAIE